MVQGASVALGLSCVHHAVQILTCGEIRGQEWWILIPIRVLVVDVGAGGTVHVFGRRSTRIRSGECGE